MKRKTTQILIYVVAVFSFIQCTYTSPDDLSWPEVKSENKPGTYWWWMGSAVDEKGLTYNLKNLANAGVGNVHVIPIYGVEGEEQRYIDFLTPKWMKMLSYTVDKSGELKMNVDMSTTTGWPFGGSHVTSQYAASKIEYEVITVPGGKTIERQIDPVNLEAVMAYTDNDRSVDLSDKLDKGGKLKWTATNGDWKIYILHKQGTGQMVKRAAPGNVGLVLDPFSVEGMKYYLERYNKAFADYKGINLRAQYHDSYEYYHADWTNNLFEKFSARYDYDLRLYLPAILDTNRINPHIKADYRRLLADFHLEYIETWNDWSHQKGWITRNEAHGAPGNLLDLYAASDIPETETFGSRKFKIPGIRFIKENNSPSVPPNPLILKFASSAAHVAGKQLIASETGTWLREHYKVSLSQVKPEVDELFYCGINHIFYHGNAYSPEDAAWPGWIFYATTHFEKENTIWNDFSELNNYVTRCQSILQSGKPSNDILLYWSVEDVYHSFPDLLVKTMTVHNIDWFEDFEFGKLAADLDEKGYSFDYISDSQLQNVKYKNGKLITNGNSFKTIIVPKTKHIPLKTWKQLELIAEEGGKIIFQDSLPEDVPGFADLDERRSELNKFKSELKFDNIDNDELRKAEVGEGFFLLGKNIVDALQICDVQAEQLVQHGLNFIRRINNDGYYYFITNLSGEKIDTWMPLSVKFESALLYDPRYENKIGTAGVRQNNDNSEVYLQLQPGESCIVRTFTSENVNFKKWKYTKAADDPIEINGEWQVDFVNGAPKLPSSFKTKVLKSWTEFGDHSAESFAGTGKYTIEFELPEVQTDGWVLDLGKVCESAKIYLNSKEVEGLWSFPFNIPVGQYLRKGKNLLEIDVTNLAANRIRDMDRRGVVWRKFFFVNIFYKKFDASNWSVMKSGLLGPVTLRPVKYINY